MLKIRRERYMCQFYEDYLESCTLSGTTCPYKGNSEKCTSKKSKSILEGNTKIIF